MTAVKNKLVEIHSATDFEDAGKNRTEGNCDLGICYVKAGDRVLRAAETDWGSPEYRIGSGWALVKQMGLTIDMIALVAEANNIRL